MINNRCIMTRLLLWNGPQTNFSNILLLLSIISSTLPFSSTLLHSNENESINKTARLEDRPPIRTFIINGTNPYKHILSDLEAELASESYSRINSIIRYVLFRYNIKCNYLLNPHL